MRLDDVRGFVFDVDGTLVRRFPDGVHPLPGAVEVLEAIRASGRPLALFSNGSHVPPEVFAEHLRADGLAVSRRRDGLAGAQRALLPAAPARGRAGPAVRAGPGARAADRRGDPRRRGRPRRRRARAPHRPRGVPGHGARGARDPRRRPAADRQLPARLRGRQRPDLQPRGDAHGGDREGRAARARSSSASRRRRPCWSFEDRLGVASQDLLVTGDDVRMDVGLGLLGGSRTVLVRSGISGALDVSTLPERRRPHAVVDGVGELLAWL